MWIKKPSNINFFILKKYFFLFLTHFFIMTPLAWAIPGQEYLEGLIKNFSNLFNGPDIQSCNIDQGPKWKEGTQDLDFKFDGVSFIESNSPEVVKGPGYVFKHDGNGGTQKIKNRPITGCTELYFFHINKSESNLLFHLRVKSASSKISKISIKGSAYTNQQYPHDPIGGGQKGQSYMTARDWLTKQYEYNYKIDVNSQYKSVITKIFNNKAMVDGKFLICGSRPFHVALVVSEENINIQKMNKFTSSQAKGLILEADEGKYGRVSAIFNKSKIKGNISFESGIPNGELKWHINTDSKFKDLQDQTMKPIFRMEGSSDRSYGNYGREYDISLKIDNKLKECKHYEVVFGTNHNDTKKEYSTWNCPIKLDDDIVPVLTTSKSSEQTLTSFEVMPNQRRNMSIKFLPCGLSISKQNLKIKESACIK